VTDTEHPPSTSPSRKPRLRVSGLIAMAGILGAVAAHFCGLPVPLPRALLLPGAVVGTVVVVITGLTRVPGSAALVILLSVVVSVLLLALLIHAFRWGVFAIRRSLALTNKERH
jgi:hypothetical protein